MYPQLNLPDLINGAFELFGGFALARNVLQLHRDKVLRGVHWLPTIYFTAWGYWNLFYYPHLGQWMSFVGGMLVVAVNTVWLLQIMWYYREQ